MVAKKPVKAGSVKMCPSYGGCSTSDYRNPSIRAFNTSVLRAYRLMRQSQGNVEVSLPEDHFPICCEPDFKVTLEHSQDKDCARVVCEGRGLLVKPINSRIMGVCSETFGGPYLTAALVYTFLAG